MLKATDTFDTIERLIQENGELRAEIERLKEGRFTEEEFQNLCHTFSAEDRNRFFTGCAEYQRKLFGVADRDRKPVGCTCDSMEPVLSLFED